MKHKEEREEDIHEDEAAASEQSAEPEMIATLVVIEETHLEKRSRLRERRNVIIVGLAALALLALVVTPTVYAMLHRETDGHQVAGKIV